MFYLTCLLDYFVTVKVGGVNFMRYFWHILFWLVVIVYTFLTIRSQNESIEFAFRLTSELMIFMVSVTYFHFYIFTKYFWRKLYYRYVLFLLALMTPTVLLFQIYFTNNYEYTNSVFQTTASFIFIVFMTTSLKIFRRTYYQKIKLQQIQNKQLETELKQLKSQVNPHFLFNNLNTIYALSLEKSDKLPEVIIKLSDLMRYQLSSSQSDKVLLADEIEFIENYIELEKTRLAEDYEITFQQKGDTSDKKIAPMLLIVIVENCFKHGLDKINTRGNINIEVSVSDNYLELITENNIYKKDYSESINMGLDNLKKRLLLIYPDNHSLIIKEEEGIFKVQLRVIL